MYETPGPRRSRSRSRQRPQAKNIRDSSPSRLPATQPQQLSRRLKAPSGEPDMDSEPTAPSAAAAAAPTPTRRSSRHILGASPSSMMSSTRTPLMDDDEDDEDDVSSADEPMTSRRKPQKTPIKQEPEGDDEFRPGRSSARRGSNATSKRSISRGNDAASSSRSTALDRKPSRRDSRGSASGAGAAPSSSSALVPIPCHPDLRPGDTVNDPANPNVHGCPYCDKVYTGQHARSICRRHQMSKHGIELEVQVKKSRWDNNPNRPATEEEKHQRTLESKRRWAAKDRRRRRCEKLGIPFIDSEDEDGGEGSPAAESFSAALPPSSSSKSRNDSGKSVTRQRSMSGSVAGGSEASSTKPARSASARRPPARAFESSEAETPTQAPPQPPRQPRHGQQMRVYQPEYGMARSYSLDGQPPMMSHGPPPPPSHPPPPMHYYGHSPPGSMYGAPPPQQQQPQQHHSLPPPPPPPPQAMPAYYPPATMVATPGRMLPSSHTRTPSNSSQPLQLALHLPSQKRPQVASPPKRTIRAPARESSSTTTLSQKSPLLPSAKVDRKSSRTPDSDSDEEAAEILLAISASPARPVKETEPAATASHRRTNSTLAQSTHVDDLFSANGPPADETPIKQLDSTHDKRPDAQTWPYRRRGASVSSLPDEDPFQPPSLRPHDDLSSSVSRREHPETPMTPDVDSHHRRSRRPHYALQPALDLRRGPPPPPSFKQADPFRVPERIENPFPEPSSQSLLSSPPMEAAQAAPIPATTSALRSGVTPFRTRGAGMATPARNGAIPPSPALFSFSSPSGLDITHKLGLAPAVSVPESPTWLEMVRATPDARNRRNRTGSTESEPAAIHPFDESPRKRLRL